jgi:murein DD-endopeptidase MepM/ murein hydrolase activator NlpD
MPRAGSFLLMVFLLSQRVAVGCEMADQAAFAEPLGSPISGDSAHLASPFGMLFHPLLQEMRMHTGVDWAAPAGTPIAALRGGRITETGRRGQFGNIVVIDHGAGWRTLYAHLSKMNVGLGDCVKVGDEIGEVGVTGLTSGPHVHLELLQYGWPVDPQKSHEP